MRYLAKIDGEGVVTKIFVAAPDIAEPEAHYGAVETWRDGGPRKNMAGIGFTYDLARDAFIPPKPYPSWLLDESTCRWIPPVPRPSDGQEYLWDEVNTNWRVDDAS